MPLGPTSRCDARNQGVCEYGFLVTPEEVEIYSHEHSVVGGAFSKLDVGSEVRFTLAPHESAKGPQTSSVQMVGRG